MTVTIHALTLYSHVSQQYANWFQEDRNKVYINLNAFNMNPHLLSQCTVY